MSPFQINLLEILRTLSEIMTAGVAITAFSLLLFALTFNLRDRVARTFAWIMVCVVVVFTTEAFASNALQPGEIDFWLRLQWLGIGLLPPIYLHFSDALLASTGKPSRGRRILAVRVSYLISLGFLVTLPFDGLAGRLVTDQPPAPYLQPTWGTDLFTLYYLALMFLSWVNVFRAYRRTVTATSRRRMIYLLIGASAPPLGSFPYLLFSTDFSARHGYIFWSTAVFSSFIVSGLLVVMAYGVAFFGVPWPDRVVRNRLFVWIMRGPVVASLALGATTIVRRTAEGFGMSDYHALVPITMVVVILLGQYLITLISPLAERWLFYGNDQQDLNQVKVLEDRLLTRNDLKQFQETVLAAICDRLQAPGAYLYAVQPGSLELVATIGKGRSEEEFVSDEITRLVSESGALPELFAIGKDTLVPLYQNPDLGLERELLGILGVVNWQIDQLDPEQREPLTRLVDRAAMALRDRRMQAQIFAAIESLASQMGYLQQLRAASQFDPGNALLSDTTLEQEDLVTWVKEALAHYWGGPKLTSSPLLRLRVVASKLEQSEGNPANALRSILREAIDQVRPEGERRFTAEWVLYNILEMKFLEGKKVRDIARRLAMSEADLYRKQRVAIESVARAILDMEKQARSGSGADVVQQESIETHR
jgi:hypothetical protein